MSKKSVKRTARFDHEADDWLKYIAKEEGRTVSDLLRIFAIGGINQWVSKGKLSLPVELKKRLSK